MFLCPAALWACTAAAQPSAEPDWAARLRQDAQALHDVYRRDHPGAVDEQNPSFGPWLERGLAGALARAATARSYGHYWWAMREYALLRPMLVIHSRKIAASMSVLRHKALPIRG